MTGLGGGRYPYSHDPLAEHDVRSSAFPWHWAVALSALVAGLVYIAGMVLKGWPR